jgi:pyrroline-5-carboxylate reductase
MLADVIILSVKPQSAKEMCFQLQPFFHLQKTLIISVMAGLKIKTLNKWLGEKIPIIRAMPNTPALIGEGATGLFASKAVSNIQKQLAESLLSTIGIIAWLDHEKQIDAITALSGSGPAYFFYMIEAMQIAAKKLGLSEEISNIFSLQTAYGAAKLALNSDISTSALRGQVTSQGGTTEAALSVFQDAHFLSLIEKAMAAASDRSKKLSDFHK